MTSTIHTSTTTCSTFAILITFSLLLFFLHNVNSADGQPTCSCTLSLFKLQYHNSSVPVTSLALGDLTNPGYDDVVVQFGNSFYHASNLGSIALNSSADQFT